MKMRNRAILVTAVFLLAVMTVCSFAGCEHGSRSKLIATETTVETTTETVAPTESSETTVATTETTVETTTEETTTETTVESNYKNNDVDFGNDKKAAETHKDNKGGKVTTTKSPSKKPSTTKKTTTKKSAANKTATTKAPTKKPTTKPVVKPKTTKTPTKKPTPVPSKGYAMVKFKFSVTMRDKDENGNYIKHSFTKNIKCVTTNYHSKQIGDYHVYEEGIILKTVKSEVGSNIRNYSASKSKVVEFLN